MGNLNIIYFLILIIIIGLSACSFDFFSNNNNLKNNNIKNNNVKNNNIKNNNIKNNNIKNNNLKNNNIENNNNNSFLEEQIKINKTNYSNFSKERDEIDELLKKYNNENNTELEFGPNIMLDANKETLGFCSLGEFYDNKDNNFTGTIKDLKNCKNVKCAMKLKEII